MNINELRASKDYQEAVEKIRGYRPGFEFDVEFYRIPTAKANGLKFVLQDCKEMGLIKSVSVSLDIDMNITEERYKRL